LTTAQVQPGAENGARAGTQVLKLLSTAINVHVLRALAEGPRSLIDLRIEVGSPPQTTMRAHLRTLADTEVVIRHRQTDFPSPVELELTAAGEELLGVAQVLDNWLPRAPGGPLELGTSAAKSAVRALIGGWANSIIRALAARPLSLSELNELISGISYPSLERRLTAMRLAGQIERTVGDGRGTPYAVTRWLREAIAPLAAAARWERTWAPAQTTPIRTLDVEAAFLLAIPLLRLPDEATGTCRLAVQVGGDNGERLAGVVVGVSAGEIVSCVASVHGKADAWVSGSAAAWLRAVIEADARGLEIGGDSELGRGLLDCLHRALFVGDLG
jgi:DNA-binding HxlR family transcriptional regulator